MASMRRLSHRLGLAGAALLLLSLGLWLVSNHYQRDGFIAEQRERGWVEIGRFGDHWPAWLVSERQANDRLEFAREDGTRHVYDGWRGYRLKASALRAASGEETILVFRSLHRNSTPHEVEAER